MTSFVTICDKKKKSDNCTSLQQALMGEEAEDHTHSPPFFGAVF